MFSILLVFLLSEASGFCPHTIHPRHERTLPQPFVNQTPKRNYYISHKAPHTSLKSHHQSKDSNFLMDQFKTADGEIIDPYRVLKVGRKADKDEIRKSYRTLSKKYHPDGVRFRDVFPGKCNNLDEVRDEWERIKLAYEILSDRKTRLKYDRHSALNDPASALGRVALETLGWGASSLVKGLMGLGDMAVKSIDNKDRLRNTPDDTKRNKPGSISNQGAFVKFRTTQDDLVLLQNNALILALPANSMFYEQMQGKSNGNDFIFQVGRITMDLLAWGMISMADLVVQMGEVVVKHARQELDKHVEEMKMSKVEWNYET